MFPGSICVSGFATPVVNCGTTRVPVGLPMYDLHTKQLSEDMSNMSGRLPWRWLYLNTCVLGV